MQVVLKYGIVCSKQRLFVEQLFNSLHVMRSNVWRRGKVSSDRGLLNFNECCNPEDHGSMFLRNVTVHVQTYSVKTRKPQSVIFFPRKPDNVEGLMAERGRSLYSLFLHYLSTAFKVLLFI